ncbi:hypothetical protein PXK30_22140 [Phaeobacter gallaeciensis]|uniref:hypothetical protein n=1 Tax=Phaeobacter gallaeciensis TaxID=60890 RepID=UPI00237FB7C8|nr:hypothetical protein [Phaeobacter gallaeciensis]MDE4306340.1 hypothetical protein [Phaeobacter gallaeciensis]MDE4310791.1 hypothetical protein [Phaeobacter gallaeciensis]MDE4315261.1 hypothetical protein [Phaeobacter gallaeciensis]MDE4319733.1 hypothetical protein [Phaeobacter gallaeciensis]MDE4324182.1 hypothetical protein [Phaeobacter gallaeciensis]
MNLLHSLLVLLATQATAGDKSELIQALEASGKHFFEDERREVRVDGCQMTTFRWRDVPDQGWVLWTSFQFDMVDAQLDEDKRVPGKKYAYAKLEDGPPEIGFAFYGFSMREGTLTRQERSVLREPSKKAAPSPRGDGTSHYYEWRDSMLISMKGPGVEEKAITFTSTYDAYVKEFCTFSS